MVAALDGVTVIDCTEAPAGSFCSMMLADMGAKVIKVERPGTGDNQRGNGPHRTVARCVFRASQRR